MAIGNSDQALSAFAGPLCEPTAPVFGLLEPNHGKSGLRTRKRLWPAMLSACVVTVVGVAVSPAYAAPISTARSIADQVSSGTSAVIAQWAPFIKEASRRFGIAEDWIKAVIRMESGGHTTSPNGAPITSKAGAMGLMQLMPETWHEMQNQYGLGKDPYNPHDNVMAGTAYLRALYQQFGFPKMFAAYNAGPATVSQHRDLPPETRGYVSGISRILGLKKQAPQPLPIAAHSGVQTVSAHAETGAATFTRPDGSQIAVDAPSVVSIRTPIANEFAPGVQTVLSMGARFQGVLEKPENVVSVLRAHGAKV